nr:hypothetical protein [Tanacetum cinerariifolium]
MKDHIKWGQFEKDRYNADIRATNILLQMLPKDIYTLINHYTDAKDIWDNVKMLLEGSELTKEDRESQLYDDFKHFQQHKGESIHDYYVRFAKLINDMRNIKMTMSRLQLNSKFVNNMLPEWGRFETHAKENKMMLERFSQPTVDPLALMSNVSNPQHYSPSSLASSSTQVPQPLADSSSSAELIKTLTNTLALLTQSYKTFLPQTNNQLRISSNARNQATVQDGRVVVQNVQGRQNRGHIAQNCTQPKGPQNSEYYKDKMLLMQAQENGVALDADQLLFLAGGQDNAFDGDVDEQPVQDLALNDAACAHHEEHVMHDSVQLDHVVDSHADYTSDSNMIPYDQYNDMCEPHPQSISNPSQNTVVKNSLTVELSTYKEQVELYEQQAKFELTEQEQMINEQLRLIISDRNFKEETLKKELHSIKLQVASTINHHKSMVEEVTFLKRDFKQKENKYLEDFLDMKYLKDKVEDRLIKQDQSLQTVHMLCKPKPHYNELNRVAIGYKNPLPHPFQTKVIPFFKTLKDNFEGIQKALTKEIKEMKDVFEELEAEVTQYAVDRKHDAIEQKNLLIANDNLIAECLSQEVFYVETNSELNVARFTKMHVANTTIEARCLALEAELANLDDKSHHANQEELINHFSKLELQVTCSDTDRTLKVQTTDSHITKLTDQVTNLQAQNDLFRAENDKIKQHYKELYDSIKITRANHIEQMTKLTTKNVNLKTSVSKDKVKPQVLTREKHVIDVEPVVPRLRNNRDAHLDYLRHLKESVETICDIVKEAKVVRPLDRSIVSAYRYTKHSQELLEYSIITCPQGSQQRAKQLAHIPLIRKKQVTFAKPTEKSDSTTHQHVVTVKPHKTNVPMPPSAGVNSFPNASGLQPKSNVKPNRISPAKGVNKLPVEDQPRTNMSHLRTSNRVDSSYRLKRT